MTAPRLQVRECQLASRPARTRMPFRFGIAVLTAMPILHVRLRLEASDGSTVHGVSASGLPPLWFDKNPNSSHADNVRDLLTSVQRAAAAYVEAGAATAFDLHRSLEADVRAACAADGLNELTAGFGIALLDCAIVDGVCRLTHTTLHQALKQDLLGVGLELARLVPAAALPSIRVRHTIGMADPIRAADTVSTLDDGLPETLEDVVRVYGVRIFKVKIERDTGASLARLRRIAEVVDSVPYYEVTLDGNEQFHDMGEFHAFVMRVAAEKALATLWHRTLWIEQPVARSVALTTAVSGELRKVDRLKPVIIDESDASDDALDQALELGYRGISAKNCKGVFRTLHSYRRIAERNARAGPPVILSSEDLTNVGIVPLHQDLCVAAALGITHSERNGHHYFSGLSHCSTREQQQALVEYPSLYSRRPNGLVALDVRAGALDLRELNAAGYGVASEPDWEAMEPLAPGSLPTF